VAASNEQTADPKGRSAAGSSPLKRRVKEQRVKVYRQAINEAAEKVFAAKGSDRSHMREIATEAGISLGTLYAVIDGKESLLIGIHSARMREFMDCIRDASHAHTETLASHLAVVRDGARFFLDHPDFLRMCCKAGFGWATRFSEDAGGSELWEEGAEIPRELFVRGVAEKVYVEDDPDLMVRKMLALKQAELAYWVDQGMKTPHDVLLDRLERQFVRAFCRPESR
jgi:AcrR family transcriptional regulator